MFESGSNEITKQARRRLVGAALLAILAIIILPLAMNDEPPQRPAPLRVDINAANTTNEQASSIAMTPAKPSAVDETSGANELGEEVNTTAPLSAVTTPAVTTLVTPALPSAQELAQMRAQDKQQRATAEQNKPAVESTSKPLEKKKSVVAQAKPSAAPGAKKSAGNQTAVLLNDHKVPATATKPATEKSRAEGGIYQIQIGAFANNQVADDMVKDLKAKGFTAFAMQSGIYTRVRVGRQLSRQDAEAMIAKLKRSGFNGVLAK